MSVVLCCDSEQAARLDSQAKRFQASAETAEKNEQELTAERDRLKGEVGLWQPK
jgi:hypothetical protein